MTSALFLNMKSIRIIQFFIYIRRLSLTAVFSALLFLLMYCNASAAERVQDIDSPVVIVIDPGHGGENEGTKEFLSNGEDYLEKYMTMTTALAMYDELCRYDNVEVYLTREKDINQTLKQRARYAKDVQADFLFSIHYNASENHSWYGSEVWISCEPPFHQYGYQFAYNHLNNMKEMGLFIRGIKSRISESGTGDYYGILRESGKLGIPAVIIEHCHVDNEKDVPFCNTTEKLQEFGRKDAISVAQYFGLKRKDNDIDYHSFHAFPETDLTVLHSDVFLDQTQPEENAIELIEANFSEGLISIRAQAKDLQSPLMYYTFSLDGGETFSEHLPWPDTDLLTGIYPEDVQLSFAFSSAETELKVLLRVYNKFEKMTESNCLFISRSMDENASKDETDTSKYIPQSLVTETGSAHMQERNLSLRKICFILLCFLVPLFLALLLYRMFKKNKRQ